MKTKQAYGAVKKTVISVVATLALYSSPVLGANGKSAINLPAQNLAAALQGLARQSDIQVLFSSDIVRGLKVSALKGEYSAMEALNRLLVGTGLVAIVTGQDSFAIAPASQENQTPLETVTVTATRTKNRAFDVPASVTSVARGQIEDSQASTISDVIKQIPNATMGGSPRSAGQLPTVRGYQGPQVVLQVDGARRALDASVGTYTPLLLDLNFVKQADVMRGPSSAVYGGGGLGGIMSFSTFDAEDIVAQGETAGGRIKLINRTGDGRRGANVIGATLADDWTLLAGGTYEVDQNIHDGAGGENIQNGDTTNYLLKAGYFPNDLNILKLSYSHYFDDSFGPTNPAGNADTTTGYQQQKRKQQEVIGNWEFQDEDQSLFDGKVSFYHTKISYDLQSRVSPASDMTIKGTTVGGAAQNTVRVDTTALVHQLTFGVDGYKDKLSNTSGGTANAVMPDGRRWALGGFIQDEIKILDNWTLTPTIRYDSYEATASGQTDNTADRFSPKIALHWQTLPQLGLYANYSQAFRGPTVSELYQNLTGTSNFANFTPNAGLKPEVSRALETGMTLAFDDVVQDGDAFRTKLSVFDEKVKNLIERQTIGTYVRTAPFGGTGSIFQYQNVSRAHRWGGELELAYRLKDIAVNLGASRLRVKNQDTGERLFSPPDEVSAGLNYFVDDNLSLRYGGRFVDAQDYDDTANRQRSGFSVHDIGVAYERDWYRFDAGVTNLFDKAYASYHQSLSSNYIYEEGRSVNLSLSAQF